MNVIADSRAVRSGRQIPHLSPIGQYNDIAVNNNTMSKRNAKTDDTASKTKADDFIEALLDPRVTEALCKSLSAMITLTNEEVLTKKFGKLFDDVKTMQRQTDNLNKTTADLKLENVKLQKRIDDLETQSRCENLIIRGVPESSYAERVSGGSSAGNSTIATATIAETSLAMEKAVISLCQERLGITVSPSDISAAHRLQKGTKDSTRPILIRFTNRKVRDSVYFAKKALRNDSSIDKIYISEHLTKDVGDIFYEARKMVREKKLFASWSARGVIYVKRTSQGDERPTIVRSKEEVVHAANGRRL